MCHHQWRNGGTEAQRQRGMYSSIEGRNSQFNIFPLVPLVFVDNDNIGTSSREGDVMMDTHTSKNAMVKLNHPKGDEFKYPSNPVARKKENIVRNNLKHTFLQTRRKDGRHNPYLKVHNLLFWVNHQLLKNKPHAAPASRRAKKRGVHLVDNSIPKHEETWVKNIVLSENSHQMESREYEDMDEKFGPSLGTFYPWGYIEGEEKEISWFNAGIRIGVGIGLGMCLGIGIGFELLMRTYQATTRTFRRRLSWCHYFLLGITDGYAVHIHKLSKL